MRISDWSSDVCSSDLPIARPQATLADRREQPFVGLVGKASRHSQPPLSRFALSIRVCHCIQTSTRNGSRERQCRAKTSDLPRSEEHTSELQSLMRISYAVFCLKKKRTDKEHKKIIEQDNIPYTIHCTSHYNIFK